MQVKILAYQQPKVVVKKRKQRAIVFKEERGEKEDAARLFLYQAVTSSIQPPLDLRESGLLSSVPQGHAPPPNSDYSYESGRSFSAMLSHVIGRED